MAPFHVTHHLEFLHQSFLSVPWDAFWLSWVIGWWDQHLIRPFSQGNLMISKQLTQAGSVERSHVLLQDEDYQSWDVHGKKSSRGGWESVERRACVETDGAGVLLCALGKPCDTISWDFWRASHWEGQSVFTDCSWVGNGKILLRTRWISSGVLKSLWSKSKCKMDFFLCVWNIATGWARFQ